MLLHAHLVSWPWYSCLLLLASLPQVAALLKENCALVAGDGDPAFLQNYRHAEINAGAIDSLPSLKT